LDGAPGIVLRRALPRLLGGMPADGRGIEQHLGAIERRQARRLGIPLSQQISDATRANRVSNERNPRSPGAK